MNLRVRSHERKVQEIDIDYKSRMEQEEEEEEEEGLTQRDMQAAGKAVVVAQYVRTYSEPAALEPAINNS